MKGQSSSQSCREYAQRRCVGVSAQIGALAMRLVAAMTIIATSAAVSQAGQWQREFHFYEADTNSKCFIYIMKPHYLSMGYRPDGTAFLTFGLESELGRRILPPDILSSVDVTFSFDAGSYHAPFLFDEIRGDLYTEAQHAEELRHRFASASSVEIQFQDLSTGDRVAYNIPTYGIVEALNSIAYCDPNRSRFSVEAQQRAQTLLQINTFRHVTRIAPTEMGEFADTLADGRSLGELVQSYQIRSPYSCPPELRVNCFNALKDPFGSEAKFVVPKWGEWQDLMTPGSAEMNNFIEDHIQAAWNAGFPMFTDAEIRKMSYLTSRFSNNRKCKLGIASDSSPLTQDQKSKACEMLAEDEAWLNQSYCYNEGLRTWIECLTQRSANTDSEVESIETEPDQNTLILANSSVYNGTCIAMDSAVMGMGVNGFGGRDKPNTFTISVQQDGSTFINGQLIQPKYVRHEENGSLAFTALPVADVSIAMGGQLGIARIMPDVSDESYNALNRAARGMFNSVMGNRDRIFLIEMSTRAFAFADVVNNGATNMAPARCR